METREERRAVPSQPPARGTPPAAAARLGMVPAVGLLLLAALNLGIIAHLAWPGGTLGRAVVGLVLAVVVADVAAVLLLLRPWWPGRGERAAVSRVEQRRQERLARRAKGGGAG